VLQVERHRPSRFVHTATTGAQAIDRARRTSRHHLTPAGGEIVSGGEGAHSWKLALLLGGARLLAPALILGVFGLLVAGIIPGSGWTWALTGACFALFLALSVGQKPYEGREDEDTLRRVLAAASFLLSASLFYYLLSRALATRWSLANAPSIVFLVGLTVASAIVLNLPKLRRQVLGGVGKARFGASGVLGPFALLAVLFVVMTSVFAAVTLIAADEGLITLTARPELPSFEEVAQLYVWQFCKSVPLLDVNETLRWEPPFVYTGTGTGVLVLLYKLGVIVPVIGTFLFLWSAQFDAKTNATTPA
jgi:hypothetical protein